jgi:uncharacterized protein (TIGR04255 family)
VQTFGSADADPGSVSFILDLDAILDFSQPNGLIPLALSDAEMAIDNLRDFERQCFESLITDRLREVFDA